MVAIHTKFIGPTNTRGSQYKAYTTKDRKTVTVNAANCLSAEENQNIAALEYCKMMGWSGTLVRGGTDTGFVYVFLPRFVGEFHDSGGSILELPEVTK